MPLNNEQALLASVANQPVQVAVAVEEAFMMYQQVIQLTFIVLFDFEFLRVP